MSQLCLGPILSSLTFGKSHGHSVGTDDLCSLESLKDKIHFTQQHLTRTLHILGLGAKRVREREGGTRHMGKATVTSARSTNSDYSTEMTRYFI